MIAARRKPVLLALALGLGLVAGLAAWQARGQSLIVDLSDYAVEITTGFAGANVMLFGAVEPDSDVLVVVRGPEGPVTLRRKDRVAEIWMNVASMTFDHVPSFYAFAASRPVDEMLNDALLRRLEIGIENIEVSPRGSASQNIIDAWRDALVRRMEEQELYRLQAGEVTVRADQLFRTRISFPSNVPTGVYRATVYQVRDGQVVKAQTTPLRVRKAGVEAQLFNFAHEQAGLYGLVAVLLALGAGWLSHMAFRRN